VVIGSAAFGHTPGKDALTKCNGDVFIDRAGVRLLLLHAQFRQEIENGARLNFQLACQLVDPNFLHRGDCL
jgi:hypothetical protein